MFPAWNIQNLPESNLVCIEIDLLCHKWLLAEVNYHTSFNKYSDSNTHYKLSDVYQILPCSRNLLTFAAKYFTNKTQYIMHTFKNMQVLKLLSVYTQYTD